MSKFYKTIKTLTMLSTLIFAGNTYASAPETESEALRYNHFRTHNHDRIDDREEVKPSRNCNDTMWKYKQEKMTGTLFGIATGSFLIITLEIIKFFWA